MKVRRMHAQVVLSTILYAAPIWRDAWRKKKYKTKLEAVNRKLAIRVTGAYRTVSLEAVLVVAGMPPLELLAEERADRLNGISVTTARNKLLQDWQQRWERQGNTWTKRLIPDVAAWYSRKHGEVNHHFTQVITGHGVFNTFRHRIGKSTSPRCWFCDDEDTAEHTLMNCKRWEAERTLMETEAGRELTVEGFLDFVTQAEAAWKAVDKFTSSVMKNKAKIERQKEEQQ